MSHWVSRILLIQLGLDATKIINMQLRRLARDIFFHLPGSGEFVDGVWNMVQALIHWSSGNSELMFLYLIPDWRYEEEYDEND